MSITTELRDFVDGLACHKITRDLLCEIADRIDAEAKDNELFRREAEPFCDRLREAAAERADVTLFGVDYVALPLDAGGETIRIGDELGGYNKVVEVVELRYGRSGWILISRDGNAYHDTAAFVHVQPDSWERIIEDAQADGVRYHNDGRPSDFDALVERCKRLAGEE